MKIFASFVNKWTVFAPLRGMLAMACILLICSCHKSSSPGETPNFTINSISIDNSSFDVLTHAYTRQPVIRLSMNQAIKQSAAATAISVSDANGAVVKVNFAFPKDSVVTIQPQSPLTPLGKFHFSIVDGFLANSGASFNGNVQKDFVAGIDSSRKFPTLSDSALLDTIQRRTLAYFWEYGHPVSGLARERSNGDDNTVTSGGSGFGIMAIIAGVNRNFITRQQALARMQTIVGFLKNTAVKFHGAFPHWINGSTGAVIPFSTNDNGADLVETSYLMEGLLCARQYFNDPGTAETNLRADINTLWNNVEWDWFRQNNQNTLYWHWSPDKSFIINQPITGWNECLVTYVLAASSTTHAIPKIVYDNGWASNGAMKNGAPYYGYTLPLGPAYGGPLFFAHYSFQGINPNGLSDAYANYATQNSNHTLINFSYCTANPKHYFGYSDSCWGLTASDIQNGYNASSPTSDLGTLSPTAAVSSLPYAPQQAMKAIKFYYYVLGDKLFGSYGFVDAFSLNDAWFASSFLAIDQGPQVTMIENYRSGLLWNLFTSCPEVKAGMKALGFTAPYL